MRKKIYIAVLNQGWIRPEIADLITRLRERNEYDLIISYPANKPISYNRNKVVKRFLETDADFLLMIDGDCPPPEDILEMADHDKDIIGAVAFGYLNNMLVPFVMKKNKMGSYDMADAEIGSGVVECDAIGSGVMMIARRVLEKMPYPFRNEYDPEGMKTKGLDFNFCERAKKLGFRVWADTNKLASHWTTIDLKTIWLTIDKLNKRR